MIHLMKDETVVAEKVIDTIGALEKTVIAFENVVPGCTYKVVAPKLENETMIGNNDDFITLASVSDETIYKIEGVTLNTTDDKITIEADVSVNHTVTENTMLIVALYNSQGALVSTKTIPVNFNNEKIKSITDSMNICEYDDVKIMLWDAECSPLTEFVK